MESSNEKHLFKIGMFCDIITVFTVTSDQLNALLLNKIIDFFKKMNLTDPKLLKVHYVNVNFHLQASLWETQELE